MGFYKQLKIHEQESSEFRTVDGEMQYRCPLCNRWYYFDEPRLKKLKDWMEGKTVIECHWCETEQWQREGGE